MHTSIFTTMSQMAKEYNAINLSQGFPNFDTDQRMVEIVQKMASEAVHQYMPMAGYPPLLEEIVKLIQKQYRVQIHPNEELLVTAGATQGIFTAVQALVPYGSEVIILDPAYDCYETPVVLKGANAIRISLDEDYSVDFNLLETHLNERTSMIIMNNPHNPSGRVWSEKDFESLETLLEKYPNIILLADEVYEFLTFEKPHISILHRPKFKNRSVIVSSFGKTMHLTGWKVGYLTAPLNLMNPIKEVHQYLVFSVSSLSQACIAEYLPNYSIPSVAIGFQEKRDLFRKLLHSSPFELLPCEGTYFQVVSYASISNESDIDFTKRLVKECGVSSIPLSVFYKQKTDLKRLRLCFAKDDAMLIKAAEKLHHLK
ncbi:MAG: methionine aminotransferase [Flavobacterium sp.]